MNNANLIAEARRNAPESVDESLIMRLVVALEAAEPRVIDELRAIATSPESLERARKRIEDELIEWRDACLSMLGRRNGLAIFNRDGTPSSIIRFGFEDAFRIALKAEADHMEAEVTR